MPLSPVGDTLTLSPRSTQGRHATDPHSSHDWLAKPHAPSVFTSSRTIVIITCKKVLKGHGYSCQRRTLKGRSSWRPTDGAVLGVRCCGGNGPDHCPAGVGGPGTAALEVQVAKWVITLLLAA